MELIKNSGATNIVEAQTIHLVDEYYGQQQQQQQQQNQQQQQSQPQHHVHYLDGGDPSGGHHHHHLIHEGPEGTSITIATQLSPATSAGLAYYPLQSFNTTNAAVVAASVAAVAGSGTTGSELDQYTTDSSMLEHNQTTSTTSSSGGSAGAGGGGGHRAQRIRFSLSPATIDEPSNEPVYGQVPFNVDQIVANSGADGGAAGATLKRVKI